MNRFKVDISISDFTSACQPLAVGDLFGSEEGVEETQGMNMSIMVQSFLLLKRFCDLYSDTTSVSQAFEPTILLLRQVPYKNMEKATKEKLDKVAITLRNNLQAADEKRRPLQLQKRKAMAIKTFLPKFHQNYSIDKKRYDPDRERAKAGKEKAEYKKELKGAVRELRKDAQFIATARLEETKRKDEAYKKKIDKIMGQLASQEGAMRGYEREQKKGRKKK